MIAYRRDVIQNEIEAGTGAAIAIAVDDTGTRTALRLWFADLEEQRGPVVELKPFGLRGYRATLGFGRFAGEIVRTIQAAAAEDVRLARALIASIASDIELDVCGQPRDEWIVGSGAFKITATVRGLPAAPNDALLGVCREVIVPLMAAMAELIGYDVIEDEGCEGAEMEGNVLVSLISRRERNPRNRLLCLRLHGERCACCEIEPRSVYGNAGGIIEVHHIEPLSTLGAPRPYDPALDLVPLCPNCHRAVHTRKPLPLSINELRSLLDRPQAGEAAA